MNQYGEMARRHWAQWLPGRSAAIENPEAFFTGLGEDDIDSGTATARTPMTEGTSVMFDFGGVVDGYCSDFGRTIYCGEPPDDYRDVYDVMLAAQEAGRLASVPGAIARDVNVACRRPIEEAGLGESRHARDVELPVDRAIDGRVGSGVPGGESV